MKKFVKQQARRQVSHVQRSWNRKVSFKGLGLGQWVFLILGSAWLASLLP